MCLGSLFLLGDILRPLSSRALLFEKLQRLGGFVWMTLGSVSSVEALLIAQLRFYALLFEQLKPMLVFDLFLAEDGVARKA